MNISRSPLPNFDHGSSPQKFTQDNLDFITKIRCISASFGQTVSKSLHLSSLADITGDPHLPPLRRRGESAFDLLFWIKSIPPFINFIGSSSDKIREGFTP